MSAHRSDGKHSKTETRIARAMREVQLESWNEVSDRARLEKLRKRYGGKYDLVIENTVTNETWLVEWKDGAPKFTQENTDRWNR